MWTTRFSDPSIPKFPRFWGLNRFYVESKQLPSVHDTSGSPNFSLSRTRRILFPVCGLFPRRSKLAARVLTFLNGGPLGALLVTGDTLSFDSNNLRECGTVLGPASKSSSTFATGALVNAVPLHPRHLAYQAKKIRCSPPCLRARCGIFVRSPFQG